LAETESDFMNGWTKAFERYLINDLNPLLNGDGPAEIMLCKYEKYLRWHGERERLKHVVVKGACTTCNEVDGSTRRGQSGKIDD
jgi:Fe-S cluster biogenesis protein NfuA